MLQFQAKNVILVQQEVEEIDKILDNLEEFYRGPASRVLKNVFIELFRREGATRKTQRWQSLKTSTRISRYRRHYRTRGRRTGRPSHKILWDTGALRRSYVHQPTVHINKSEMRIGSNIPYAKYHETGTRYIPARPVIGYAQIISPDRLQRALRKYLKKRFQNATA